MRFLRPEAPSYDDSASLPATSPVSRTDEKIRTRNARLDASDGHRRPPSEGNRFHSSGEEIGLTGQIDDDSRVFRRLGWE